MGPFSLRVALALCISPKQSAIGQRHWGLYIVRGGINPGEHGFRSRGVGVVEIRGIYDPGMGSYPLRVALAPRAPANQRSTNGIGFKHRAGRYRPGGLPFSFACCRGCSDMEEFLNQGWGPIIPGLPSLYASTRPSQSVIGPWDRGFPHRAGRCRPGRTRSSTPGCRTYRDMEGCLNR